jgi:Rrf2 family iron-sulfur cluster assembly transcriptional regulator
VDLADFDADGLQQRQKIAARQGISPDFMDHIMARLKASGLVASIRGRQGGFRLERAAAEISLWDIFCAVEDSLFPVQCVEESGCQLEAHCISHDAWLDVAGIIQGELAGRSLGDMLKKWQDKKVRVAAISSSLLRGQECKGPKKASST